MNIKKFNPNNSVSAHNNTIIGSNVLPDGMSAPFEHFYGYLATNGTMEGHEHPTDEIYIVFDGNGVVTIGDEKCAVSAGDVIEIPPNVWHTMTNESGKPLLWAALWWTVREKQL